MESKQPALFFDNNNLIKLIIFFERNKSFKIHRDKIQDREY